MPRVGAEFRDRNEHVDIVGRTTRRRFLALLHERKPQVLDELRRTVLPAFGKAVAEADSDAWPWTPLRKWWVIDGWPWTGAQERWKQVELRTHPYTRLLGSELLIWAKNHRLTDDDWLLGTAFQTVRWWHEQRTGVPSIPGAVFLPDRLPECSGFQPDVGSSGGGSMSFPAPLRFTLPQATEDGWELRWWIYFWEPWDDFEKRIRAAFEQTLCDYRDRCEAQAEQAGLERSPETRGEIDRDLIRLIEWLVPPTKSHEEIGASEEPPRDRSTISRAVDRAADLIGLDLDRMDLDRP